ncbi:MAG: pilus assembly PilX N-terminal domain-containing protein [Deltaproteobacteria bacterium]|nr:pilus assembly PilX N-terminal domain-containing protein [Deltaproteobacteria bacterium]
MKEKYLPENEKGSITVLAVVLLMLLTLLGIAATTTSSIEVRIAGNELRHKLAFYSAEAAKGWVIWNPDLYGSQNITSGTKHLFPNYTDPYVPDTSNLSEPNFPDPKALNPSTNQSFNGSVEYRSSEDPPRGSGYEASEYRAHRYIMTCNGCSSHDTSMQIEIGFYRIGF